MDSEILLVLVGLVSGLLVAWAASAVVRLRSKPLERLSTKDKYAPQPATKDDIAKLRAAVEDLKAQAKGPRG